MLLPVYIGVGFFALILGFGVYHVSTTPPPGTTNPITYVTSPAVSYYYPVPPGQPVVTTIPPSGVVYAPASYPNNPAPAYSNNANANYYQPPNAPAPVPVQAAPVQVTNTVPDPAATGYTPQPAAATAIPADNYPPAPVYSSQPPTQTPGANQ